MQASPSSPSFNSYSSASANLPEIAARVVEEFRELDWEDATGSTQDGGMKEDEFEFAVVCNKKQESTVTADEIFFNGQIKPFYPLFDRPRIRSPLGKLMREERENDVSLSCSSSEADDLDNLQPGTYCVWTPKASKESPGICKKSNSTGSSKRWNKFRDLLYRSNSDGKDTFVFLTPTHNNNNKKKVSAQEIKDSNNSNKASKAVQEHYVRNRFIKEEDKKRSFLPYRQDLLGFFNNSNGFTKNLHPF